MRQFYFEINLINIKWTPDHIILSSANPVSPTPHCTFSSSFSQSNNLYDSMYQLNLAKKEGLSDKNPETYRYKNV